MNPGNLDRIFIRNLALWCWLGVQEAERASPQQMLLTLEISLVPARRDELQDTLCYVLVADRIRALTQHQSFKLVESLAEQIATLILADYRVAKVKVEVTKPAAIPEAAGVGAIIERSQPL